MATYHLNNVTIGYKNFSGVKGQYNAEGARNFHVFFNDMSEAHKYSDLGFNVKFPEVSERVIEDVDKDTVDYVPRPHMKVNVNLNSKYPPKIALIKVTSTGTVVDKQLLTTPLEVSMLDSMWISHAEVEISEYRYGGGPSVTAYLRTLYVEVEQDEFYDRYGI